MFRRPQRTLLPGLGVACAVLAGVLVAVTFAASLIGVGLPTAGAPAGPGPALQIEAREEAIERAREQARAPRFASTVARAATTTSAIDRELTATTERVEPSPALAVEPERDPVAPPPPPPPARATGPGTDGSPGPDGGAATASASPRNPLEPLGSGVNDATDGVADTLRSLTDGLGDGVQPLSPALGGVLTQTGDALGDVVEGTGNVLGRLLGRPAGRR